MIYTAYMWALIFFATVFFGGLLGVFLPVARKGPLYSLIVKGWARTIVRCSGVKLKVSGMEKLNRQMPYVFMSNHQSYFDVICLVGYLPHPVRFVAKKELSYIPIIGQLMWVTGHVIIDRAKSEKAVSELKKAGEKIRSGTSILVFPEGTRSPDHKLGVFKKGGFMLALEAGVPLAPISITGTRPMMPKGGFSFKRSDLTIVAGDPIETDEFTLERRQELMDKTRLSIIRNFPRNTHEWEANKDDAALSGA